MKSMIAGLLLIGTALGALAQGQITGAVLDGEDETPLAGATVILKETNQSTITDAMGRFTITGVQFGTYQVAVSYSGFSSKVQTINHASDGEVVTILLERKIRMGDEVVVSATRATEKTPITFSTIERKTMEKQNLGQDLPFLLNQSTGVVATSDAGAGVGYTGIRIRGTDTRGINVTVNGIPLNDSESHGVFFVNMPDFASSVDNIQIQRGVGTSTNGAGAFGATINIQTETFNPEPYAEVSNSAGSFNTRKHTVRMGTGLINDKFTVDARLSRIYSDGYLDRAFTDLSSWFVSAGYYGKSTLVKLNVFSGKEQTYQSWWGTPEARINNDVEGMIEHVANNGLSREDSLNLLSSGRTYNYYLYDNETDNYQQDHYQLIFAQDIGQKMTLNAALHFTHGEGFFEQYRGNDDLSNYNLPPVVIGNDSIFGTDLIRRRWLDNDFYGTTYSLNYRPNPNWDVIVGGGWNEYVGDHFGEVIWARFASTSNIRDQYYFNLGKKQDFNNFVKATWLALPRLRIFGDLQLRTINYTNTGTDNDLSLIDVNTDFAFFNPKAGFNYTLNPDAAIYASYGIANREPIRRDFIDTPLEGGPRHETLQNIEAGIRGKVDKIQFSANAFYMRYRDQLVMTGELNDVGAPIRTNVSDSYRAGVEAESTMPLGSRFFWTGNASISQNRIRSFREFLYGEEVVVINHRNTDISFSPPVVANSVFSWMPVKGAEVTLLTKYVSRQFLDNTSNAGRAIPSFFVNDLRLIYDLDVPWAKTVRFNLLINNILNEKYVSNGYTFGYLWGETEIRENFFYPQAGRHFLAGITIGI